MWWTSSGGRRQAGAGGIRMAALGRGSRGFGPRHKGFPRTDGKESPTNRGFRGDPEIQSQEMVMPSALTETDFVARGWVAGPVFTAPVAISKALEWQGHTISPLRTPLTVQP